MNKDLTHSDVDHQNILNNPYALAEIQKADGIRDRESAKIKCGEAHLTASAIDAANPVVNASKLDDLLIDQIS